VPRAIWEGDEGAQSPCSSLWVIVCQQLVCFFYSQCGYLDVIHLLLLNKALYPVRSNFVRWLLLSVAFFRG